MSVTPNLGLPLPDVNNLQTYDIGKLREALTTIDQVLPAKADLVGGKIPADQLPAYVDDVLEFENFAALPATGAPGVIYVTIDTSPVRQWRWSGSAYAEIAAAYQLPKATPSVLGGIKVGSGLVIDPDGVLSVAGGGPGSGPPVYGDVVLTATAGQTVFTVSGGYAPGQLDVFLNGVFLAGNGDDFTATNGTTFTLTFGASAGDTLIARRWIYLPEAQAVNKNGDTMAGALNFAPLTSVASATTVNIGLAQSNHVTITGTTTITGFGVSAPGVERTVLFAGALVLTHNAASLILPGGANITTAAGDAAVFVSLGAGNWRCAGYMRAGGQALVVPSQATPYADTATATTAVPYGRYRLTASLDLTLPASPADGVWVDVVNTSGTTTARVLRNGQNINGLAEDLTLDKQWIALRFVFRAGYGWIIT